MKSLDQFVIDGMAPIIAKRDQAIAAATEAAEAQFKRDVAELTRVGRLIYAGVRDPNNPKPAEPAPTTSTEAIKAALRHLPARFTRDDLFTYIREHFPSKEIRDNLPSCFRKMVTNQRGIRHGKQQGTYEQIALVEPKIDINTEGGEADEPEQANTRGVD